MSHADPKTMPGCNAGITTIVLGFSVEAVHATTDRINGRNGKIKGDSSGFRFRFHTGVCGGGGDGCGEHLPYRIVFKLRSGCSLTGSFWSLSLVVAALTTT